MRETEKKDLLPEGRQGEALLQESKLEATKTVYIESYGCQMNFSDSEIVASILNKQGYATIDKPEEADLVLLNTCSIRDKAEQTVRNRLQHLKHTQKKGKDFKVGILGCMAERMREQLLEEEKLVDLVAGPDAYRTLPVMLNELEGGQKAVNTLLSREETYDDITPVRLGNNKVTAFISIMRGCDNMCAFCVVPFTRGRERSREPQTIVHEATSLFEQGYREVTLLGQNVDSFRWNVDSKGNIKNTAEPVVDFADLLELVALVDPKLRVRFSTSHPKDMTDKVLQVMAKYNNICDYIHLPVQSGDSEILAKMNRGYSREWYLDRIAAIRKFIPHCGISTDIISGFCSESEEQHQNTLSLMQEVAFDMSYMFKYSERPKTLAARKFSDDVPETVKSRRLQEIISLQGETSKKRYARFIGEVQEILIEGTSKRSPEHLFGRNSQNAVVVVPKGNLKPGDYAWARILSSTSATLQGETVEAISE